MDSYGVVTHAHSTALLDGCEHVAGVCAVLPRCACAGDGNSAVAVAAMRLLLAAGAVPDTWAPNGSSALMLAASANGVSALQVCAQVC